MDLYLEWLVLACTHTHTHTLVECLVTCRWRWSRSECCFLGRSTWCSHSASSAPSSSLSSEGLWVSAHPSVYPSISSITHSSPFFIKVILECSLDSCFNYIYQYEPYMKDNVGFPKVMVSSVALGSTVKMQNFTCNFYDLRCNNTIYG